jgi:uncharacterized protein (TIRG00374 family)
MKVTRLFSLVGIFIFIYILMNIDVGKTWEILSKADLSLITLAVGISVVTVTMKAIKWKILIGVYSKDYPLSFVLKSWLMGFSLSMVTPARIGDISRAYYVKDKIGVGKGITTVIIDRVIDVGILFCLAILGFIGFVAFLTQYSNVFSIVAMLFVLFISGIYLSTKKRFVSMFLRPVFSRFVPEKHKSSINITFHDFYDGLNSMKSSKRSVLLATLVGLATWFITILQYVVLTAAIGVNVSYFFMMSIVPMVALLDMLPISFSGIGTRDAALILFLSFLTIGKEYAISLSILVLVFGYLVIGLAGALLMLRKHSRQ